MDRNLYISPHGVKDEVSLSARRAWIEIRNVRVQVYVSDLSLSARRAWIEILFCRYSARCVGVALRKESVDRNDIRNPATTLPSMSLSARRAWIEMIVGENQVVLQ